MKFIRYVIIWFRWLPVALYQDSGDFLKVFDRWQRWLAEKSATRADEDMGFIPYYSHQRFRYEFVEFVQTCYLQEIATAKAAIAALAQLECALNSDKVNPSFKATQTERLDPDCVPYQPKNLFVMELEIDYQQLIANLRTKSDLSQTPERKVTIAFNPAGEKIIKVLQLSPLSETLLQLCDGRQNVREIAAEFSRLNVGFDGIPADKATLFGLMQLRKDGLIAVSSYPLTEEEAETEDSESASASQYSRGRHPANNQQPWPLGKSLENPPALG